MIGWLTANWRIAAIAGVVLCAFAAGWSVNGLRCETARLRVQMEADQRVLAGWAAARKVHESALEGYRNDLATVANRPPQPVIVRSPAPAVPASATGAGGTGPSGGRGAYSETERDIGPDIAACRDELYRLKALIHAVRPP